MKTFSGRKDVPIKQDGKIKWILVSPEIYDQIIEKTDHERNHSHIKNCECVFCEWMDEEIIKAL